MVWNRIANIKETEKMSADETRKHILFNKINIIIAFVFVLLIIADIVEINIKGWNFTVDLWANYIIVLLCGIHILLNKFKFYRFSVFLFTIDIGFIVLFFGPLTGRVFPNLYFWGPFAPAFFSIVPYLFFTQKKDIKWRNSLLVIYLITIIFFDIYIISLPYSNPQINEIIKADRIFYKLTPIIAFLFINLTMYYASKLNDNLKVKLINSNKILEDKNTELIKLNTEKTRILKIIGHDLRGPMSSMIQMSYLLKEQGKDMPDENRNNILSAMEMSGEKSLRVLNDLVNWSKLRPISIKDSSEHIVLNDLINRTIELMGMAINNKEIVFKNIVPLNISIFANDKMIEAVLRNLISNAIKFSQKGGVIEVKAEVAQEFVTVCIQDYGIGMNAIILNNIFNDNVINARKGTDNEEGTGLGLIFCKEFILNHNGRIWVESEEGKGSKFCFIVPASKITT